MSIFIFPNSYFMHVYYADDDEDDQEIFCEAILQIDPTIKVTLSGNGQELLEILKEQAQLPDFIFLDINMPKMSGIECLLQLKLDNRLKSIPVIIYSTTSNENEINKLLLLGADDVMTKAASFEKLIQSIHKILTKESDISILQ